MSELQRLWKALLKQLQPTALRNTASGVVQVGKVDGNGTVINHHHAPRRKAPRASEEHKNVLRLMDEVPDRIAVLDFMEREFATRMVIELKPAQLYRLRRYVELVVAKVQPQTQTAPPPLEPPPPELARLAAEYRASSARRQALYDKNAGRTP